MRGHNNSIKAFNLKKSGSPDRLCSLIICLLILVVTGCGPRHFVREKTDPHSIKKLAVLPFENFTSDEYAGEKIRRAVVADLLSRGIDVVEPGEITRAVRELKIKSLSVMILSEVQKLGKASGADTVMMGSVECYGVSRGISVSYPEVTVNLKVLETSTGKVLWSVHHTSGGAGFWTRHFGSEGISLSEASEKVVREAMNTLF
jgi:hypothetical protein